MKDWTPADLSRLIDDALNAFAFEFFGAHEFKSLGRDEQLKITRGLKVDAATRFAYQWMMRGVK